MNRAIEIVKQNPWKITLGTIITVAVSVGSIYFTDQRYIKQVDYEADRVQIIKEAIEEHNKQIKELSK